MSARLCTGQVDLRVPLLLCVKGRTSPPTSPSGVSVAPSPGGEEGGTPTSPSDIEDRIVTQMGPGVDAVPLESETTAGPDFTTESEKQTGWEAASTPEGTSPLPGGYSQALEYSLEPRTLNPHECLLWNAQMRVAVWWTPLNSL